MSKIAIIGSGSWGVALGIYLANNGNQVKIWSFSDEEKDKINNERKCVFLPNVVIPENGGNRINRSYAPCRFDCRR